MVGTVCRVTRPLEPPQVVKLRRTSPSSLSVLSLLVAGMVLFVVRNQRAQREEAYHLERIRRVVSHRRPPPKPWDLVDILQEE